MRLSNYTLSVSLQYLENIGVAKRGGTGGTCPLGAYSVTKNSAKNAL